MKLLINSSLFLDMEKPSNRLDDFRSPISITFACIVGLSLALMDAYYYPKNPVELEAKEVVASILLVMDSGTAEKFYVSTVFRMLGMIIGISVGVSLSMAEQYIWMSYKDSKEDWHEDDWKLVVYRCMIVAPVILVCTLLMKRFPKYAFPIVIFAVQVPAGLFGKGVHDAASKVMSGLAALLVATLSIVVFERINTTALLTEANSKAITGVLRICELAIEADSSLSEEFTSHSETVHKSVSQAESSIQTYAQWRSLTLRELKKDFSILVKPMRPLYYEAFSLYWSNVQCYRATSYRAEIMFCDSEESFQYHFKPERDRIVESLRTIRAELDTFFSREYFTDEITESTLKRIITPQLWDTLYLSQTVMRKKYIETRGECFTTFAQRWNVTHMMRRLVNMTIALLEYVRALSRLFLKDEDKRTILDRQLDELLDSLDEMRTSELPGVRQRSQSEISPESPTRNAFPLSTEDETAPLKTFTRSETKGGL